jgi:hypothetical protein
MESKIDLNAVKALSNEQRMNLAASIRKDPELWNAVNGIGGLSENSEKGLVQGNTTFQREVLANVDVSLKNKQGAEQKAKTNQYGFFKMEVVPDMYFVVFSKGSVSSEPKEIEIQAGMTFSINYDFEKIG